MSIFSKLGFEKKKSVYSRWPVGTDGEKEAPALLCHCKNTNFDDALTVAALEAEEIPTLCVHPGDGAFSSVMLGVSGQGTQIFVPESMLERAKEILNGIELEEENS